MDLTRISEILRMLQPRQEKVIRLYFGLGCQRPHSALEIAEAFEVSSQVIAGILGAAESRLARLGLTPVQMRLQFLAHQFIRHAVIMPLDLDVIVDVRTDLLPLRQEVAFHRQGPQGGPVQLFEQAGPAGIPAFAKGPPVQSIEQGRDGFIEVCQSQEPGVTQRCDNPALGYLHAGLDLSLVSRLVRTRRENCQPIVFGHLAIGWI
jgi:predicted DNA-binding protein YlxM (UPF0122 family)